MEWAEFFRALQRRWYIVAIPAFLGLVLGFVTTSGDTTGDDAFQEYEATHVLIVDLIDPNAVPIGNLGQTALLVTGTDVQERAAEILETDRDPERLGRQATAEADTDTQSIAITATDRVPREAEAIADAFARSLRAQIGAQAAESRDEQIALLEEDLQRVQGQVDQAEAELFLAPNDPTATAKFDSAINEFRLTSEELRGLRSQPLDAVALTTLNSALAEPVGEDGLAAPRSRTARMALGGLIGLLLGAGVVFVVERFDDRIVSPEAAQTAFELPVIGQIPALPRRHQGEFILLSQPSSPFAEAYRSVRSLLTFAFTSRESDSSWAPVLVVSSPGPREAKTTTVSQLATAFAETGQRVMVFDCDFRRPRQHEVFGVSRTPGLTDSLMAEEGNGSAAAATLLARLQRPTEVANVTLVPSGPSTSVPAGLLPKVLDLINRAAGQVDLVIVDTPPLLLANDAIELIGSADAVLLTAMAGRTSRTSAGRAGELLAQVNAPTLGVLLAGTSLRAAGYDQYYGYRDQTEPRGWWPPWRRRGAADEAEVAAAADADDAPAGTDEADGTDEAGEPDAAGPDQEADEAQEEAAGPEPDEESDLSPESATPAS